MQRPWIFLAACLLFLAATFESAAGNRYAGDYSGYVSSRRAGRAIRQEFNLRVQDNGKVDLSLYHENDRALMVGEFTGRVGSNGRFLLTGRNGRILATIGKGKFILGSTIIDGRKGSLSGHPFIWMGSEYICACVTMVGGIGSHTISGGVITDVTQLPPSSGGGARGSWIRGLSRPLRGSPPVPIAP